MSSTMTESSGLTSNASSVTLKSLDSMCSATTIDLCVDLQDSNEIPEGPSLPVLPRFIPSTVNKKRNRDEYLASSSDAPLFSSDDLPASSVENYIEPTFKRQHQIPWYEMAQGWSGCVIDLSSVYTKRPATIKPFKRTGDSSVWMGSDESTENEDIDRQDAVRKALRVMETGGSIDGDDELWLEDEEGPDLGDDIHENTQTLEEKLQQALVDRALQLTEDPGGFEGPVFPYWQKQPNYLLGFHKVQEQAQQKVFSCVDEGAEVVDLSTMYMQQVRAPTLRPLRYYIKTVPKEVNGDIHYQLLTPALRLYLSNNLLEEVPGEIFHLRNLEVLSLRSNNLTEILPSIGKLSKLRELNLGSNQFNWLPWELLGLLQTSLWRCMMYPNPLIRPVPSIWNPPPVRRLRRYFEPQVNEPQEYEPRQVASTQIAFLDITGASIRYWPPAPSSLPEHWPDLQLDAKFNGPPPEQHTKAPSLLELALRACKEASQLSQLPFLLPKDCPQHLTQLLQRTWYLKEAGGQTCSVCGKEYIIARTEWIEWWYCIPEQDSLLGPRAYLTMNRYAAYAMSRTPVPFLRRGCSWACWEENANPLHTGWNSATLPGGLKEEMGLPREIHTPANMRRTIPPSGRVRSGFPVRGEPFE